MNDLIWGLLAGFVAGGFTLWPIAIAREKAERMEELHTYLRETDQVKEWVLWHHMYMKSLQ